MKILRNTLCLAAAFASFGVAANAKPASLAFDWFEYTPDPQAPTWTKGEHPNPLFTGFYPDPSICQVGEDYYLINSTFAYFPGIPIFHSRDLVNWKQIGHVIHRPDQLPYDGLGVSRGIFAPAISYHNGTFYVVCTQVDAGGNFVVTAKDPAGPWSDPVWLGFEGIDPSLFFDDDGRAWMVNNGAPEGKPLYEGHRAIWIQEFDPVAMKMIGPRSVLVNGGVDISKKPVWIEGPHIFRKDGWYYLCCAEGGTSVNHSQVIHRSKSVTGPYTPWSGNPILTQRELSGAVPGAVTSTGHADLVIGPDQQWWAVFLAVRPYQGRYSPMGRETFLLPVTWTSDGWPVILESGKRVPLVSRNPAGVNYGLAEARYDGFEGWRDDFKNATLDQRWIMLRSPKAPWWKINAAAGQLELEPRAERLSGKGNPSYLGRRVQNSSFSAATELGLPTSEKISGGLAIFQGEKHHFYAGVRRLGAGYELFVEKLAGGAPEIVAQIAIKQGKALGLRVVLKEAVCRFEYRIDGGAWQALGDTYDGKLLTTELAGGFVGATVGVHARLEP